ncbi:uncharacterized protein PITG_10464 [Phytophthora infestans T30-4]|uniref:Uncharacterized protein n=1 Tax=Phytophthora infestans (strain T30-4) TaxID=403677 RepID=D0NFD5_PHYIT|nr:uncharacterized protein PITG_10464 [Phytophthora infestans T30-4]EEY56924.1 conserved hypothetical protein [Phytophthora infestans T30-4]|eukprot:XP_002902252.1 conserved hypothetical protein [Phytophthora infestans T30-4]
MLMARRTRHNRSAQVLGLEKFHGEDYTMWRDTVLTHIETLDEKYQRGLLRKDQPEATAKRKRWPHQHWTRARSELLNLFNQALPNVFLSGLPDQVTGSGMQEA